MPPSSSGLCAAGICSAGRALVPFQCPVPVRSRSLAPDWSGKAWTGYCPTAGTRIQAGIRLLSEIDGNGDSIRGSDRIDACLKFYRNKGEPLIFDTFLRKPIPCIVDQHGTLTIAWNSPTPHRSNAVFERNQVLAPQADVLPGVCYTILAMRTAGHRHVAIPPHLFAHTMHQVCGIDRDSVIELEVFLTGIHRRDGR